MLDLPRSAQFEDGSSLALRLGGSLTTGVMRATQHLVLGGCRAAAAALEPERVGAVGSAPSAPSSRALSVDDSRAGLRAVDVLTDDPSAPPFAEPLLLVDHETTARAFADLPDDPGSAIDTRTLHEVFHPTALLYQRAPYGDYVAGSARLGATSDADRHDGDGRVPGRAPL
jgi:hypothetical protein